MHVNVFLAENSIQNLKSTPFFHGVPINDTTGRREGFHPGGGFTHSEVRRHDGLHQQGHQNSRSAALDAVGNLGRNIGML